MAESVRLMVRNVRLGTRIRWCCRAPVGRGEMSGMMNQTPIGGDDLLFVVLFGALTVFGLALLAFGAFMAFLGLPW